MKHIHLFFIGALLLSCSKAPVPEILRYEDVRPYIDQFNADDEELYIQHIPNDSVHAFLEKNIPLLDSFKVWCDGREIFAADEIQALNISLPGN